MLGCKEMFEIHEYCCVLKESIENFCKSWTSGQDIRHLAYCEKNTEKKTCSGLFKPNSFGGWEQLFIATDEENGSPTTEVMFQLIIAALILVFIVLKY